MAATAVGSLLGVAVAATVLEADEAEDALRSRLLGLVMLVKPGWVASPLVAVVIVAVGLVGVETVELASAVASMSVKKRQPVLD